MGTMEPFMAERIVALEHREIVSQSPVSFVAHYHTALIVVAAASAFVISVLTLLVILYRRKVGDDISRFYTIFPYLFFFVCRWEV